MEPLAFLDAVQIAYLQLVVVIGPVLNVSLDTMYLHQTLTVSLAMGLLFAHNALSLVVGLQHLVQLAFKDTMLIALTNALHVLHPIVLIVTQILMDKFVLNLEMAS